jgi:NitT/TauT family transport system substrate-binding protein
MKILLSRRRFLVSFPLAGAAGLVGSPKSAYAEPPPETTTVRLPNQVGAICLAPGYVAAELLRAEGFTDVRYVAPESGVDSSVLLARGEMDFDLNFAPAHISSIEAGAPIAVLAGVHAGCLELVANDSVHAVADLKGKRVGVDSFSSQPHQLVVLMVAYVGLDPERDIQWIENPEATSMQLFADGKIDAFLSTPPEPQELRARKIGHTILSTSVDRPWSQYYCCMLAGSAEYVDRYPAATKRVLRALLKAADLCRSEPEWVAQRLVDGEFTPRYDYALETLIEVRYDVWRDYDPEDTLRFYALRMREAGMIKSDPNRIIAEATDWRFLDEIKRELKT